MGFKLFFNNAILFSSCLPESCRFYKRIKKIENEQINLLLNCIKRNKNTLFGIEHHFSSITSIQEYRDYVPIRGYDEYKEWLQQMQSGASNILTRDEIKLFEPTGGSSGGTKLIPYTDILSTSFQKGIAVWLYDLYKSYPKIFYLKSRLCDDWIDSNVICQARSIIDGNGS